MQIYQYSIQEGTCAIYSIVYKQSRYTLELNKQLQIVQLTGKYNSKAPQELIDELTTQLQEIIS